MQDPLAAQMVMTHLLELAHTFCLQHWRTQKQAVWRADMRRCFVVGNGPVQLPATYACVTTLRLGWGTNTLEPWAAQDGAQQTRISG